MTTPTPLQLWRARAGMRKPNAIRPEGAPVDGNWGRAPQQTMGAWPHDDAIPEWFPGRREWGGWWDHVTPWFCVFVAEGGNLSPNAEVLITDVTLWLKRRDGSWHQIASGAPGWAARYEVMGGAIAGAPDVLRDASGAHCIPTPDYKIHGGHARLALPFVDGEPDVSGVMVGVTHRIQGPGAASARYLVWPGVDWWPAVDTRAADFAPANYNPGACTGPMVLAGTSEVQSYAITEL